MEIYKDYGLIDFSFKNGFEVTFYYRGYNFFPLFRIEYFTPKTWNLLKKCNTKYLFRIKFFKLYFTIKKKTS